MYRSISILRLPSSSRRSPWCRRLSRLSSDPSKRTRKARGKIARAPRHLKIWNDYFLFVVSLPTSNHTTILSTTFIRDILSRTDCTTIGVREQHIHLQNSESMERDTTIQDDGDIEKGAGSLSSSAPQDASINTQEEAQLSNQADESENSLPTPKDDLRANRPRINSLLPDLTEEELMRHSQHLSDIENEGDSDRAYQETAQICGIPYNLFLMLVALIIAVIVGTVLLVVLYDREGSRDDLQDEGPLEVDAPTPAPTMEPTIAG